MSLVPFWPGRYAPDQGYYTSQPATVAQLNALRRYVEYIRRSVNGYLDQIDADADAVQRLDDRVSRAETTLKEHEDRLTGLDATVARLRDEVKDITSEYQSLMARGVIHEVTVTPLPKGWRFTAIGNKASTQHDVSFESDGTIPLVLEQRDQGTVVHLSTSGGTADPTHLHFGDDDGSLTLQLDKGILSEMKAKSTDDYMIPRIEPGPTLTLTKGKALDDWQTLVAGLIDDLRKSLDQGMAHEAGKTEVKDFRTEWRTLDDGIAVTLTVYCQSEDGTHNRQFPVELKWHNDSTLSITATDDGAKLHVRDQLQDLPVMTTGMDIDAGNGAIILYEDTWDPKAKRPVARKKAGSVDIVPDSTLTVTTDTHSIHMSAQPALNTAEKHTDDQVAKLNATIGALTSRVDSLAKTISNLQTQVEEYRDIAQRAVTGATMELTEPDNGDERGVVQTLQLTSKDGTIVATLPVETRYISQLGTIDTGVQLSGHTATVTFDRHA